MDEEVKEEKRYDAECPKCKQYTITENGSVWLQGYDIRVNYECECDNCGYSRDYSGVLSDDY